MRRNQGAGVDSRSFRFAATPSPAVTAAERAVARAEAVVATVAMIPGTLQRQWAESGGEGLGPASREAGLAAARAGQVRSPGVGMVGIEPVGDGLPHDLQRDPPRLGLDRLEVIDDIQSSLARE